MVSVDKNNQDMKEYLESLLLKDLLSSKKRENCPYCKCTRFIKYGSYKNGQRYLCKGCDRTFSKRTNTPLYNLKKSPIFIAKYLELMLNNNSLRECSKRLGISLSTSFFWRHKIFNALISLKEPTKLNEQVELRKLFIKENFKGDRNPPLKERELIWTIMASDNIGQILACPISIKRWSSISFNDKVYAKIDEKAYINAYSDRFLMAIAKKHNIKKRKLDIESTLLKKYILEVLVSLTRFNGVATKYLANYLYWITIFVVDKKYDWKSLLYEISSADSFINRLEIKNRKTLDKLIS